VRHVEPLRIGRLTVEVVCEGFAPLPLADECPGQEVDWEAERLAHPWAFHGSSAWPWHVHAFVISGPAGTVVVDSGVGSFGPWRPWAEHDPDAWAAVDRSAVGHVVLTHLHADHAGGVVVDGEPRFPNAVVSVHPGDWRRFADANETEDYVARTSLGWLLDHGRLDLDGGDREIVPGISVRHTPGHTPGHRSVLVRDQGEVLLITGDLLHLPIQAGNADQPSSHDDDPRIGQVSRRLMLWRASQAGWWVAVNHFAAPFGRVGSEGWST
jgi:glyoxylase-like metal-dependent hydrolase (beta-lactamase superfamily II)